MNTSNFLNGHIQQIAYWPKRISDAELQALTSSALLAGKSPAQLPAGSDLGEAAYLNIAALQQLLCPQLTVAQVQASMFLLAPMLLIGDATKTGLFYYDSADSSTADDGQNVLVTADGRRYKRRSVLRRYTPASGAETTMAVGEATYDDNFIYFRTAAGTVKKGALAAL